MPETPRAVAQRPVQLDVEVECAACHRPVPVAAPILRSMCGACSAPVELPVTTWLRLFQEIDERDFMLPDGERGTFTAEQSTPSGKITARWSPSLPRCIQCKNEIALIEPGVDSPIECGACTAKMSCSPAPVWLRSELPTAMQLYGIARAGEDSSVHAARGFWLTFQGTPPALSQQHRQVIEAAIGPPPVSTPIVSTQPAAKRRWGWEWYAVAICAVLIVLAVRHCGARLGTTDRPADGAEVEPSL